MTPRRKKILRLALRLVALAIAAIALAPFYWPTVGFARVASEQRVRFEPGAENAAAVIARALPGAIATVERGQFAPFAKPVEIFVCASTTSFARYGYGVASAGGFVFNGRLFISPKPQNTADRLPRLVAHELSHLHLAQRLGTFGFGGGLPGWFKEGLAVYVSGAGAETVSEADARDAIAHDRVFAPAETGSLFSAQIGAREHLAPHLFYREAAMFVAFLAQRDAAAYQRLLLAVEAGQPFAGTVRLAYGRDVAALQREFVATIKSGRSVSPP